MKLLDEMNWLVSQGRSLLDTLASPAEYGSALDWGRIALEPWQRVLLEEQVALRHRSRHRFPDVSRWIWTDRSLQQASDWQSARFKASLFPTSLPIIDACCGAGADLVALAEQHRCTAVDRDPVLLRLAQSNVVAHGLICETACTELPDPSMEMAQSGLHIDPDRRVGDQRTTWGDAFSPSLSQSMDMGRQARAAIIKLAPATEMDSSILERDNHGWRRCWLGTSRECPQQLLLRGDLLIEIPTSQVAAILLSYAQPAQFVTGQPEALCDIVDEPSEFLIEPHSAIYAAGLASGWADQHGYSALAQPRGYYTGDQPCHAPIVQCFRVVDSFGWDDRRLRKWLHKHSVGPVEFKCRLVQMDASALQRRYSRAEGQAMTCLLTQVGRSIRAIMAIREATSENTSAVPQTSKPKPS